MRSFPKVKNLGEAVRGVIESNKSDGYIPTRFIQLTESGHSTDLLAICERLIAKGETLEYLGNALKRFPTLLTLEDFASHYGASWSFSQDTVEIAKARVEYFDMIAGIIRYK